MPSTPAAATTSRTAASTLRGLAALLLERQAQRLGEEPVPGEDRHVLAEGHVAGGLARAAGRRRPSRAGRRGSASRCGSSRSTAASGSTSAGSRAERLGGGERQHRADALAAGQQRVAHRLLEAAPCRARPRSAARRGRRPRAAAAPPGRPRRVDASEQALLALEPAGRARRAVELGAEPRGQLGAALDASSAASSGSSSPERSRSATRLELGRELLERVGRRSRRAPPPRAAPRPRIPFTKPGRVGRAELLGRLDRLVDRHLGGHVGRGAAARQRHAQDVPLERRDPARATSPPRGARSARRARPGRAPRPSTSSRVKRLGLAIEQLRRPAARSRRAW